MSNSTTTLIAAVIVVLVIVFGPIATIWAMNTLFPVLAIPYTFDTWVAAVILASVIKGTTFDTKK